jgi:hypothetical protein
MLDDLPKAGAWKALEEAEKNGTYLNSKVGQLDRVVSGNIQHT